MLAHSGRPAAASTPGAHAVGATVMIGAILSVKAQAANAPVLHARGPRTLATWATLSFEKSGQAGGEEGGRGGRGNECDRALVMFG